ncbi:glycosyltransferase family 4 protein [Chitinophaga horti]|uniref:Glycosyltransferase family 4 protein n=1 Tax=Chitinophaga horti TaxID=2920382 RepID=A0ABY6J361_9BACT|nr:glycosyltransferase family 4 protein [Chitinophaga horti]UYQ94095.1 glycosyltransferase family 4 protein [Chitinophaga horti]
MTIRVFTWHIHGSYLYYLSQGPYEIYIPNSTRSEGYYGRGETFPFGANVIEVDSSLVKDMTFDCILFQSEKNYLQDQYDILSPQQRQLPAIYLEHNTPAGSAVNTRHVVDDPNVLLVHVTHYNKLMWNSQRTPTTVIDHGVTGSGIAYTGEIAKGLVVVNNISQRGRTMGWDIVQQIQQHIPLDIAGMGTEKIGLGEVLHPQLPGFRSRYRFFFHPARHTSLGLAVLEAMMDGVPVVGLATTELVTVIKDGENGYLHTDIDYLIQKMKLLLDAPELAATLGAAGQLTARRRFNIGRFTADWQRTFEQQIALRKEVTAVLEEETI